MGRYLGVVMDQPATEAAWDSDSFHFIRTGNWRWPFNSGHSVRDAVNKHAKRDVC